MPTTILPGLNVEPSYGRVDRPHYPHEPPPSHRHFAAGSRQRGRNHATALSREAARSVKRPTAEFWSFRPVPSASIRPMLELPTSCAVISDQSVAGGWARSRRVSPTTPLMMSARRCSAPPGAAASEWVTAAAPGTTTSGRTPASAMGPRRRFGGLQPHAPAGASEGRFSMSWWTEKRGGSRGVAGSLSGLESRRDRLDLHIEARERALSQRLAFLERVRGNGCSTPAVTAAGRHQPPARARLRARLREDLRPTRGAREPSFGASRPWTQAGLVASVETCQVSLVG